MPPHQYEYDIKLYAVVRVKADGQEQAELLVRDAFDQAKIVIRKPDGLPNDSIIDTKLYVDDELGPYLLAVDGQEVVD